MRKQKQMSNQNSDSWVFFVKAAFAISVLAMGAAIVFMPTELWVKGYMAMGTLLVITSSVTMTKTMRDEFESDRLLNRIHDARTERMLKEFDEAA